MKKRILFTIDLEEWFHAENIRPHIKQQDINYRAEENVETMLDLLDQHNVQATFFVLAKVAERSPAMVARIASLGHEIASHGCTHRMLTDISEQQIQNELIESKAILEDITGEKVKGFRAPTFSITEKAYELLLKAGFEYDSSLNLASTSSRYGKLDLCKFKHIRDGMYRHSSGILEFTMQSLNIHHLKLPWSGGGYFRLIPYSLFSFGLEKLYKDQETLMFYMHPWEIDSNLPILNYLPALNKFCHYYGLRNTHTKINRLLSSYECISISRYRKESAGSV